MMEQQQYAQQQLAQDNYNPLFTSYGVESRVGLAKELDPQNTILDIIYTLRGQLRNPTTGQYDIQFKRMINEEGIAIFITQVKAISNQIGTYSNFRADDKLIYAIMNKWIADLVETFFYDKEKYTYEGKELCLIENESVPSIIINMATGLMLSSFFKALGAGDRGAVTRSVNEMIQKNMRDQYSDPTGELQGRRRGLSRLNPFAR